MRKQLARELNDSVGQVLTLMLVDLEHSDLDQATQDQQVTRIETLEGSARQALQSIRQVLYNVREESPLETGFVQRVRTLLDSVEAGTGIHTKLRVSVVWPSSIPVVVAHNLYGIVEEALNNVRMHSHASNVEVHLAAEVDCVSLLVRDDGRGTHWFDDAVQQGMLGMQERAVLLGGHLDVMSTAGKGTTVRVAAPPW